MIPLEAFLALSFSPMSLPKRWDLACQWLIGEQIDLWWMSDRVRSEMDQAFVWAQHEDCHLISVVDQFYPPLLREIAVPPVLIYVQGKLDALQGLAVAMVGTRHPSKAGAERAACFASALTRAGYTIVSGLALGIDAIGHQAAIDHGGRTVAWMPCGLYHCYPQRHKGLAQALQERGALLSEFPLSVEIQKAHFLARNRLIAGMVPTLFLGEARCRSGSMISAQYAIQENRDVLVIESEFNEAGRNLMESGAVGLSYPAEWCIV